MLKVVKFGGTSLADAVQFAKVKSIVESDDTRKVVVVSAPGKRTPDDYKVNAARKSKVDDNTARMQSIKQLGV